MKITLKRILSSFIAVALLMSSLVIISMFSAAAAAGNTYYVSTSGNDANLGSLDQPFKTINHAAQIAQAGDTVFIRAGTYRETITPANSGVEGSHITYEAYRDEKVVINGCDLVTDW